MQPRGQQFDTCVDACPNCGATGGEPVQIGSGETSRETGYCDEATGCTLCAGPAIAKAEAAQ